jgi:riboflavin transporter FmnP
MKIDFSDFPALLTGIVIGPVHGILVEVVKNIIHLTKTTTVCIGEIMNVIMGSAIILSINLFTKLFAKVFKENKLSLKSYFVSGILTVIVAIIVGWLLNVIFTPIFYYLMGFPLVMETYIAGVWGSTALNTVKACFNIFPFYPVYLISKKTVKKYIK